jgi:hypothetical protein
VAAQLVRPGVGQDPPTGQHQHAVGQPLGLLQVVGGQHHGGAGGGQALDRRPGLAPRHRVQAGRRLVQEQQLRPADDAQADVDTAALAARQLADPGVGLGGQVDQLQQLADRPRAREQAGVDAQRLPHRQLEVEAGRLQHQADPGPPGPAGAARLAAEHADHAAAGRLVALQQLHGGRLAGPVGAEQGHHLPGGDLEAEVPQRGQPPVGLVQVLDGDHAHRACSCR